MNNHYLDRVVKALEDPTTGWSSKLMVEVVEPPHLAAIMRESWKDGQRVISYPLTTFVALKFHDPHTLKSLGIRYVQTQHLNCIHWLADLDWYRDRYYLIDQELQFFPNRKARYVWKLKVTGRFPWYRRVPESGEDNSTAGEVVSAKTAPDSETSPDSKGATS